MSAPTWESADEPWRFAHVLKLHAEGRGASYSRGRGLIESILRVAFAGEWPQKLYGVLPQARRVDKLDIRLPLLREGASPLRIGFVSDIHIGPTTSPRTIDRAFSHLRDAELDVLLLGGDYVFLDATMARARMLARYVASVGARTKIAVLGNHDLWTHHTRLESALRNAGVRVLVNASVQLDAPHDDVHIVGLDEPWTGHIDPCAAFSRVPGTATAIALCHSPDSVPFVRPQQAALLMCGHTHGGQIALPSGPLIVPGPLGRTYHAGLFEVDAMTLFVSRGVGGVEIPMRTYARPDVAVFELVARDPVVPVTPPRSPSIEAPSSLR